MKYYLEIKEPCSENWDEMTPTEKGRFCNSCEKEVIDFTNFSDFQLSDFLKTNKTKFCGKFKETQLNRTIVSKRNTQSRGYLKLATSLLLLSFVNDNLSGTNLPGKPIVEIPLESSKDSLTSKIINGKVIDKTTGDLMIGAIVEIKLYGLITSTDFDGKFTFQLENYALNDSIDFYITYVGYNGGIYKISKDSIDNDLIFQIEQINGCPMPIDMVVTGGPSFSILKKGEPGVTAKRRSFFGFLKRKSK